MSSLICRAQIYVLAFNADDSWGLIGLTVMENPIGAAVRAAVGAFRIFIFN